MIALPGLTLVTGRATVARAILQEFAHYEYRGLLPNRFPDRDEPLEYNTVDATLWYFQAIRAYLEQTGDGEFVRRELYDVLVRVVEHHCAGTLHGIRVDDDGLLSAGEEGYQLTWMDARVGDWVVTPRQGKPVEIQALWYNALRVLEELAQRFGDAPRAVECGNLATRALRSFRQSFWNEASGCLFDVLTPEGPDPSLRPNQLLAVSLPCALLSKAQGYRVVRIVQQKLLTPFGLRTLDPGDPRYAGTYEGDVWSRDSRYHQGTTWPWLLGAYGTALLRTAPSEAKARREVEALLEGFLPHLQVAGLGQISEILDGDAPYTPRGCFAQAWSVAELLRLAVAVAGRGTSVYRSSRNDRR